MVSKVDDVKDSITTIKVTGELRDKIKTIGGDRTANDTLAELIGVYELSKAGTEVSEIRELNQLRGFLARIEEVYVAMAKSRQDEALTAMNTIQGLQAQVASLKAELHDTRQANYTTIEQMQKKVETLQFEVEDISAQAAKDVQAAVEERVKATDAKYLMERAYETVDALNKKLQAEVEAGKEAVSSLQALKEENRLLNVTVQSLQGVQSELQRLKQTLDDEREKKNQAIGQRDILLQQIEQQRTELAEIRQSSKLLELANLSLRDELKKKAPQE